jgi:hypothetical protein
MEKERGGLDVEKAKSGGLLEAFSNRKILELQDKLGSRMQDVWVIEIISKRSQVRRLRNHRNVVDMCR